MGNCCAQAYDGGANVAGLLHGVAARLSKEEPAVLYAHRLHLCLQEVSRQCASIQSAMDTCQNVSKLVLYSAPHQLFWTLLKEI